MSYDVWLEIDTGGPEPAAVSDSRNMTSNVAPMWRKAGCDIAKWHGRSALYFGETLARAIQVIEDDLAAYTEMNPDNEWGDVNSCLDFLHELRSDCVANPKAIVRVWR